MTATSRSSELDQILKAKKFDELLLDHEEVDHAFHRLAKLCHPDRHPDDPVAAKAFVKLTTLRDDISKPPPKLVIDKWSGFESFARGDIADLYLTDDGSLFKIARNRKDNDLMERESKALQALHAKKKGPKLSSYIPELKSSLLASGRRANVMTYSADFVSVEEIVRRMKGGVEFKHIVWMMNRLLSCLGYAQVHDVVHGAVVPSHILYNLKTHDMRLVDWCYSVETGKSLSAVVRKYKSLYAPELLLQLSAHSQGDLFMAARSMQFAAARIPKAFHPLFDWCLAESPSARPGDLWSFQDMWRARAVEEYGAPKFAELTLPVH